MLSEHTTIFPVLVKADTHTGDLQMFFSKLQQRSKAERKIMHLIVSVIYPMSHKLHTNYTQHTYTHRHTNTQTVIPHTICQESDPPSPLFAAFWKRVMRDLNVQVVPAKHRLPVYHPRDGGPALEVQYPGATSPRRLLRHSQLPVLLGAKGGLRH